MSISLCNVCHYTSVSTKWQYRLSLQESFVFELSIGHWSLDRLAQLCFYMQNLIVYF